MDNNFNNQQDMMPENNQGFNNNAGFNPDMSNVYQQVNPDPGKGESKGLAIASLVFGILSLCCCCAGVPLAIPALIMSIIVLAKKKAGKGLAIGGLVTSIIGFIIGLYFLISAAVGMKYYDGIVDVMENAEEYKIEYELTGEYPPVVQDMIEDGRIPESQGDYMTETLLGMYTNMQ